MKRVFFSYAFSTWHISTIIVEYIGSSEYHDISWKSRGHIRTVLKTDHHLFVYFFPIVKQQQQQQ